MTAFEREVLNASGPVLVDFWAPWCRPCEAVDRILAELPLPVVRVNADQEPGLTARYGVLALPTVILFEGGEPRATVAGARSRAHYERAFRHWLTPADA